TGDSNFVIAELPWIVIDGFDADATRAGGEQHNSGGQTTGERRLRGWVHGSHSLKYEFCTFSSFPAKAKGEADFLSFDRGILILDEENPSSSPGTGAQPGCNRCGAAA